MVCVSYSKEKYEVKKYNDGSKYVVDKDTGENVLRSIRCGIIDIIDDFNSEIVVKLDSRPDHNGYEEYVTPHIRFFVRQI